MPRWARRYHRLVESIPVTATRKISKPQLRRQSWLVENPVYVGGDTRTHECRLLDEERRAQLLAAFERYGREPS